MILMIKRPALCALALVGVAMNAWGLSGSALEARVREISEQLRCPTCQSVSVNDSEAAFSRQMREKVRRMLMEGQSEAQIKAYFVSRYGEWILRAPKKEGLGLVLWLLPGLGMGVVGLLLLRQIILQRAAPDLPPALSPTEQAQVERDLRRFEGGKTNA